MTWNHRVFDYSTEDETHYAIHEVYYNELGHPTKATSEPVPVTGESSASLAWVLEKMEEALSKPILKFADDDSIVEA